MHVQSLPEGGRDKSLSEYAAELGIKGRAYQKAKELLVACGFLHQWRYQSGRGRWATDQLLADVTLSREEAARVRDGLPPSAQEPAVGQPGGRDVGGSGPEDKDCKKNELPHPPPQVPGQETEEAEPQGVPAPEVPEVAKAERVLLSLRYISRDLLLGVREARELADAAAEWLRRGVSVGDLCRALTTGLPPGGVRCAVGFLRHRLVEKLPAAAEPPGTDAWTAVARARELVACDGGGDEHLFRPVEDETICPRCRTAAAGPAEAGRVSWRDRVAAAGGGVPGEV
ncbi:hypothetical protein [Streptomyces sp. TRM64462]|uniref:hypothetical protein n=1 Tax=Streptomyces sp. TRM64462 TaxID=2741726 RepID=UPI0020C7E4A4|nr:hypothetical protein [Streptomyces sp. TRM64462]